jgi:mono/diheme cytochrome c family protein
LGTPVERQNHSYAFFILAALIALSTLWSVYDEFYTRRPWKRYQERSREIEIGHAQADLDWAKKQVEARRDELLQLKKDLAQAEQKIAGTEIADWRSGQFRLGLEVKDAQQNIAFAKSDLDAAYYKFRQAREHGDGSGASKVQAELAQLAGRIAKLQAVLDDKQGAYADVSAKIDSTLARRAELEKKIAEIEGPVTEAERKLATARDRTIGLEQYWLPKLNRVDRCQNCHTAVARCGFSQPWEVLAAKAKGGPGLEDDAAVAKKYCINPGALASYATVSAAFCEGEPSEPVDSASLACRDAATLARFEEIGRLYCGSRGALKKWRVKEGRPCAEEAALAALETAAKANVYDVPFVFQTHPARNELLAAHPPDKYGCTVCHGGEGVQTKGVERAEFDHARDDHFWAEWQDPLLAKVHVWGKKMDLTTASCNQCHQPDQKLQHADWLNKGKKLVADIGCYGCHPIDGYNELRKPGPRLTDVQAKVTSPGWLLSWIQYPRSFRPRTKMPNFWPEAVEDVPAKGDGLPGVGGPLLGTKAHQLREEESTAIAAYLWKTSSKPLGAVQLEGTAEEGAKLFETVGCRGCHSVDPGDAQRPNESTKDRDFAPNLSNIGAKTSASWIYTWIKNPKGYWPQTKMPNLRLTDREAGSIAQWLARKTGGLKYEAPPAFQPNYPKDKFATLAAEGKALIAKKGCFGCHDIRGFEDAQKIGADLSEFGAKAVDLLDFGDAIVNPLKQTWYNWIDTKLRHPRIYRYERVDTRMPQFDLSNDEVRALITFLRAQKPGKPDPTYLADQSDRKKAVIEGEKLVAFYGCRNCHVIDGEGGRIRDLYEGDLVTQAPPIITGEGAKTQPGWLFHFLKAPATGQIRPWLKLRMPSFGFSDADGTALVHYFSAKDDKPYPYVTVDLPAPPPALISEAKTMFGALQCLNCHTSGAPPPGVSVADLAPDLSMAKERLRPEWIPLWLADPQKLMDGTRMPTFWPDGQTPLPQYFHGDSKEQWNALRDYIFFGLGHEPAASTLLPRKQKKRVEAPARSKTAMN